MKIKSLLNKDNYFLIAILLVASILRIYHADHESLWIDEIITMVIADPSLGFTETYKLLPTLDLQPPLYFYVLKYLLYVFGYSTLVLRLFSSALGIAAVWAIYLLGRELHSKRAGLFAAAILSVNLYHIFYSQEARPYAFLALFTILSFYRLLLYLKTPTYKSAFYYGLFSALMLYGHPYGLFSLFAQFLLVIYYFCSRSWENRTALLKTCWLAALSTIVLYLPGIQIFLNAANVQSFWIELPKADVYTTMFREFFTDFEFLLVTFHLLLVFFFFRVFEEPSMSPGEGLKKRSLVSIFIVLIAWIVAGTLIPFVRSYTTVPMIVSRYLISLIPAVVLMIAVALAEIRQQVLATLLTGLILLCSLLHIFLIKKYYESPSKHDMRGAAQFVLENKTDEETIVSPIGWHFSAIYLRNIKNQVPVTSFDNWIEGLMTDSTNLKSFWFLDGQSFVQAITPRHQAFLDKHFLLSGKIDLYGATAGHYTPADSNTTRLDLKTFTPISVNEYGFIPMYNNSTTTSDAVMLEPGEYRLYIGGRSQPDEPIGGINAHLIAKISSKIVGEVFLPAGAYHQTVFLPFSVREKQEIRIELVYDNDAWVDKRDRNALIYAAYIQKL